MALIRPTNYYSALPPVSPTVCFAKTGGPVLSLIEVVRAPPGHRLDVSDISASSISNSGRAG